VASRSREVASLPNEHQRGALAQAKTQWFFGEWGALVRIGPKTLYEHAERDRLALLIGSAHAQLGSFDEAREHVHLALKWGCPPRLVAEVLVAGVHNSLGRAASVTGKQERAQKHFESAVMIEAFGSEGRLISDARRGNQLSQLGLPGHSATQQRSDGGNKTAPLSASTETNKSIESAGEKGADILARLREQGEAANRLPHDITKLVKKEILNATRQIEAFIELRDHLGTDELVGEMHGWSISPDFARYLVQTIETNDYDAVVEFGSGTSTVIIARALAKNAELRQGRGSVSHVAFEHLPEYYAQTRAQLERVGLAHFVDLALVPLVPYVAPNGVTYSYYDCEATLGALAKKLRSDPHRLLMVVDGPPGATNKHARYPAVPIILAHTGHMTVDILLDDYGRKDEKEIVDMWTDLLSARSQSWERKSIALEKGACLLSFHRAIEP